MDAAPDPEEVSLNEQIDYALKHFLFISEQRMKVFHFYVLILAAAGAGTLQLSQNYSPLVCVGISAAHFLIVWVFWTIEQRNLLLLEIPKKALSQLEKKKKWPAASRLLETDSRVRKKNPAVSYRRAMQIALSAQVFLATGLLGWLVGGALVGLWSNEVKNLNATKKPITPNSAAMISESMPEPTSAPAASPADNKQPKSDSGQTPDFLGD